MQGPQDTPNFQTGHSCWQDSLADLLITNYLCDVISAVVTVVHVKKH